MLTINHTICPQCSIGCGINLISKDGKIKGINPYKNHPINEGKNCKNCIDYIETIKQNNQEKTFDYTDKLEEITQTIKKYQNNQISIITSGKTDNEDLEEIIKFTNKNNYNILSYEDGFTKTDKKLIPTYEEIEKAEQIIIIGDIYRKNTLIARRVIHARQNGAKIININTTKNLTGYNSNQLIQIDSYENITPALKDINITPKTILILNEVENYKDIISFAEENNIKLLPLLKNPNSYSILEKIEKTGKDDINNTINDSKLLIFINEEPENYEDYNIKDKETITITQEPKGNKNEIPVKQWCEKRGSYTNTMGTTQYFEDAIHDENNYLKTVGEILETITNNI